MKNDVLGKGLHDELSSFDFKELIAVGSYGKVFRAIHVCTGKQYALKVIRKAKMQNPFYAFKHLHMELQIIPSLNHPFIAKCYGIIRTTSHVVIVEEYISGGELYYHIQKNSLSEEQTLFFAAEIVVVLEYLQQNGILFRDLKPENIMLDPRGHIKFIDFGLATIASSQNIKERVFTKTFCGTAEYLAPEILDSHYYGFAVDIWALGCIIFECITRHPPFYNKNQAIMFSNIKTSRVPIPDHCSAELKDLLNALLCKDWRLRPNLEKIKKHPWFQGVDWNQVSSGRLIPPIIPQEDETIKYSAFIKAINMARDNCSNDSLRSELSPSI
jgi:protein-serine/threonine kinase